MEAGRGEQDGDTEDDSYGEGDGVKSMVVDGASKDAGRLWLVAVVEFVLCPQ